LFQALLRWKPITARRLYEEHCQSSWREKGADR
jgi:hypothetical protein